MKILVVPASFKESLTAREAGEAIKRGILRASKNIKVTLCPIADGGEGTVDALVSALGGRKVSALVHGPLMRKIRASYGLLGGGRAVIEMAAASGLPLLKLSERNPLKTTTFGAGELIADALSRGAREIIVGIGGSATVDGGIGAAAALGAKFFDARGRELPPVGGSLRKIAHVDLSMLDRRLKMAKILVAADIASRLLGASGAARVYGPQKGASPREVALLEKGLARLAAVARRGLGVDITKLSGGGAAGGLGAGIVAFLGGRILPGAKLVCEAAGIEKLIMGHDIVIVAEGKLDSQSLAGKAPVCVARMAKRLGRPVFALCGQVAAPSAALRRVGIIAAFSSVPGIISREDALKGAAQNLERLAGELFKAVAAAGGAR